MIRNAMQGMCGKAVRRLQTLAAAMLVIIVLINIANVIGRYVFSSPFSWGEEIMLYLMIGSIFLALPAVSWDGAHIHMDILARVAPGRIRRGILALSDLISLAIGLLLVYASVPLVMQLIEFDQRSDAAKIPLAIPQGAIPLGFLLAILVLIARQISRKAAEDSDHPPQ